MNTLTLPSVKIVAITNPQVEGVNTPDDFLAYAARVSNPSNQMNNETGERLLNYCIKNNHWSVFEMVNVVMEITTTRDIARQILRHRSFSFQEFSQRYGNPLEGLGMIADREMRMQDPKNRQNSIKLDRKEVEDLQTYDIVEQDWFAKQRALVETAADFYDFAIKQGIAKEQARVFLPEGLTVSRMYMNGTLRSWIHYCMLRCGNGTQKEHKQVADAAKALLEDKFAFMKLLDYNGHS